MRDIRWDYASKCPSKLYLTAFLASFNTWALWTPCFYLAHINQWGMEEVSCNLGLSKYRTPYIFQQRMEMIKEKLTSLKTFRPEPIYAYKCTSLLSRTNIYIYMYPESKQSSLFVHFYLLSSFFFLFFDNQVWRDMFII